MKRILFLAIALITLIACSKDDEEKLVLSSDNISFNYGDGEQLSANLECTWASYNSFIARVDDKGLVRAGCVGQTVIRARTGSQSAECVVEVKPRFNTYREPILDFGMTKAMVKSLESRTLLADDTDQLLFAGEKSGVSGVTYNFENGKMTSALVGIYERSELATTLADFLRERYLVVDINSGNKTGVFINALKASDATLLINTVAGTDGIITLKYMPMSF